MPKPRHEGSHAPTPVTHVSLRLIAKEAAAPFQTYSGQEAAKAFVRSHRLTIANALSVRMLSRRWCGSMKAKRLRHSESLAAIWACSRKRTRLNWQDPMGNR
jgi:hypothetical protein